MKPPGSPESRVVAEWKFVPSPARGVPAVEESLFRSNLAGVLRAGQGLEVEVGLRVVSGPDPGISAWATSPGAARWMSRVLAGVYGPHQWVPEPPSVATEADPGSARRAHRLYPWPEPLGTAGATTAVLDAWVVALSGVPRGATLAWSWRSTPLGRPRLWDSPPPSPFRVVPAQSTPTTRTARRTEPSDLATQRPLFGRLRLSLEFERNSPALRVAGKVPAALEAAASSERGNRPFFRRASGVLGRPIGRERGIWVSVDEWERFWPRPWCPALGEPTGAADATWLLPLGRTRTGAVVGPLVEATQGRHLAVLGETGMGKSSLLVALAHRAFRSAGGVVFDPLGDTVRSLRREFSEEVRRRVVWIAPGGGAPGVNALEGIGPGAEADPIRSERRLNALVHALRRVRSGRYEESSFWGPRLEEMVTRAVRAAAAFPRGTLVDAHTLLATSARLGRPVPPAAVEPVRELADRIRDRPEDADGARRLLHEVVRSPVLVRMLCEPEPRRSTRDLVAPGRVVLLSGDAASVGEATSRYLLSVYLALVWSELLARDGSPKTFVVLDEAQWFSHESLGEMLRLGRRQNVHVVLATQAVASLPSAVGEAVWTNVSDFVAFRGSPEEAREFGRASRSVSAEDLLALPRGSAAVLLGKGHFVRWVRTARRPACATPGAGTDVDPGELPPDDPLTPAGPDGEGALRRGEGGPPTTPSDRLSEVLAVLVRRAEGLPADEPLRIELDELRRDVDPSGEGVRRAGSLLGRLGLLARDTGGPNGGQWTILAENRARVRTLAASCRGEVSVPPQPS